MHADPARLCLLDDGYRREVRTLLYESYPREPTMAWLFDAARGGYERRLRAMIRAWVRQHFYMQLPALGLLVDDRLVAVALIAPPQRRLGVADSWMWRLRMLIGAGRRSTRRFLTYQAALAASLPTQQVHVLSLLGVHPQFQGQHYAEQLLQAVHGWCVKDLDSQGVVLSTGNPHYFAFCQRMGYQEVGDLALGDFNERVFFHPNSGSAKTIIP
ncbi:GNAT family N-acetyltransferase [Pseudomonas sp. S75]|uniref:GNAT family N-acetyltransferase n=1 Tax=unclassified Pseudomonas TaxID=196821 RepID=UPI0019035E09|nr:MULTISPECIES: GNAT family N-acetyltransferase [unclassified Pseudomonas]MBJ9973868.1 GNAT family N-acetyltransferase [Pseudomonas sp. S30]MBK0152202.1 GNAT family N-acetyltransferase [Pseudomonas sp. S75]